MEKIKINNQIICMRKYVKQAKVRMINKRVKIVKSLQTKHGDELQQQKYKRKTEKLLSEIEIMKKLNVDDISKAALMKEKNWQEVLSSKTTTVEERAFALLANYNAVQTEVESFHGKNPEVALLLPDLMKHWEEKKVFRPGKNGKTLKASELRSKKKEKMIKKGHLPVKEVGKSPIDPDEDGACVHSEDPVQNMCASEVTDEDQKTFSESGEDGDYEMLGEKSVKIGPIKMTDSENSNDLVNSTDNIVPKTQKTKTQKEIACLKLGDLKGRDTISINSEKDSLEESDVDSDEETGNNLKNDPFFILGDEPIIEETNENPDSGSSPKRKIPFRTDKLHSDRSIKKNVKSRSIAQNDRHQFPKKTSRGNFKNKMHQQNKSIQGQNFQKKEFKRNSSGGKFGQRRTMQSDQRTMFSKNNYETENLNVKNKMLPSKSNDKSSRGSDRINPKTCSGNSAPGPLHPSWEAKRKMKQKEIGIAPFQGTKIKFED